MKRNLFIVALSLALGMSANAFAQTSGGSGSSGGASSGSASGTGSGVGGTFSRGGSNAGSSVGQSPRSGTQTSPGNSISGSSQTGSSQPPGIDSGQQTSPGMFQPPTTGSGSAAGTAGSSSPTTPGSGGTTSNDSLKSGVSGQPSQGSSTQGTMESRPGQTADPNQLHPVQRAQPQNPESSQAPSATDQSQFRGSGRQAAPDGSVPGGSLVALTEEERRKIRAIILSENVAQEPRANFKLQIGAKVPENVSVKPLPQQVVDIKPRYKDFGYVLAADRIVIIQRETREIDTMIPI
ncbi:MAG: DUF1236 domain-containing protein [Bradyrhizobiaceae bacterium]|nr:DUF1236 domain-containing protein [Bradyrhizobiaceae bacterium]